MPILREVSNTADSEIFLDFPKTHYAGDPNYVSPLENVIRGIFDPRSNPFFEHGECTRWILLENGRCIGRIAAFINERKARTTEIITGGCGFFECIDNQEAANMLFEAAAKWLQARGMESMDGPINFGENDQFWGLLTEGFGPASYGMNYNKPYYARLFEGFGFEIFYEQVTNVLKFKEKGLPERFFKIADWVISKEGTHFEHLDLKNLKRHVSDFIQVYNAAWANHAGFSPMKEENLMKQFESMKPILVPEFVWFAYVNEEPAAFMVMIPDVNQLLKHVNGKLDLWGKIKFAWYRWRKSVSRTRIIVMGVHPKYQRLGLESGMIRKCYDYFIQFPQYSDVELSWVGDFNPKMEALHKASGAEFYKRHITYKYVFERGRTFEKPKLLI